MDGLVQKNKIKNNIIIQIGYTKYIPKNCKYFRFVNQQKFERLCKRSDIIITHGGAGSIMTALKHNKPTIVVPRLKEFGEHEDNHQLQITRELEKQKKIIAIYNIDKLKDATIKARKWRPEKFIKRNRILNLVDNFLQNIKK